MTLAPAQLPAWPARMTAPLAAAYLGISETTLHRLAGTHYPAGRKDGGKRLWHKVELDRWLAHERGEVLDATADWPKDEFKIERAG